MVIMDEGHLILPARNCMSRTSRIVCDGFLSMVRKQNLEVYATTQTERKIDVRFKDETEYVYNCSKYAIVDQDIVLIRHNQNLDKDIKILISLKVYETDTGLIVDDAFIGNPYFKMYNTKEIVKVIPLADTKPQRKKE
jgi:hypothetical protein